MRRRRPLVIGLTGSIAMGKSVAAQTFRDLGAPVFDADQAVHRLMAPGGAAAAAVAEVFPDAVSDGAIDRARLGKAVFGDPGALARLERILHPRVRREQERFVAAARRRRAPQVVLDVPLLFETGGDRRCDATVVVSAPPFLQRARALARPGMTEARLAAILATQMPDREKRRRADFVIPSGLGRRVTRRAIVTILRRLAAAGPPRRGRPWHRARSSSTPKPPV